MLQHIKQRFIVIFDHLLRSVPGRSVLADDLRCFRFGGKRSLDHAGPDRFIDRSFFDELLRQFFQQMAASGHSSDRVAVFLD